MNGAGIYIFDNETDFITAIATINENCNAKQRQFIYLKHHLTNYTDVKKQIELLKCFNLDCFQGFRSEKLIKVCVSDSKGIKYNITYSFNNISGCRSVYGKLYNYLRKREQIYI